MTPLWDPMSKVYNNLHLGVARYPPFLKRWELHLKIEKSIEMNKQSNLYFFEIEANQSKDRI
jgi:hypothetical protein